MLLQLSNTIQFNFETPVYVKYIGLVIVGAGTIFASIARLALRKNYLPGMAAAAPATLTTRGPYKFIRHPSYSGTILAFIGLGLALNSYLIFLTLPMVFFTLKQIKLEEKMLSELHRDEWRKFTKDVPYKLIPFIY